MDIDKVTIIFKRGGTLYNSFLELFFPNVCTFCGKKVTKKSLCAECESILNAYYEGVEDCIDKKYYDMIICNYRYAGMLKNKMLDYKFNNKKYFSRLFGEIITDGITKNRLKADYLTVVPILSIKKFFRGYNQCEYIAAHVASLSNIKYEKNVLKKIKNNKMQSTLTAKERKENVKDVYSVVDKEKVLGKDIILIDDIFTTGATMNECAKVLKEAGANKVIAMTVLHSSK